MSRMNFISARTFFRVYENNFYFYVCHINLNFYIEIWYYHPEGVYFFFYETYYIQNDIFFHFDIHISLLVQALSGETSRNKVLKYYIHFHFIPNFPSDID